MIKTIILLLCICASSSFGYDQIIRKADGAPFTGQDFVVPCNYDRTNRALTLEIKEDIGVYQLDTKSYFDIQDRLKNLEADNAILKAKLNEKLIVQKEANIWSFYITLGLGIWGYSTCAPYGIVTGTMFLFSSYSNYKEAYK